MDAVDLSIRQFAGAWRVLCSAAPEYAAESAPGAEYVFSGAPIPFFNAAILTGRNLSAQALEADGRAACAWAAERGVPWLLVATEEALEPGTDADRVMDACGCARLMSLTGMIADDVPAAAQTPDGLVLSVPADAASCLAMLDINAAAYGMPLDAGKSIWGTAAFWKDHHPALGVAGGEPVSCSAVMMVEGYRYVALVATAPGRQRRGYADAVMRHALAVCRERCGEAPTFLHATDAGRPVYERMGYRAVSTHPVYIEKSLLGQH